jgi:ParB family transcriptional regulator, chromosome partitioning protein
VGKPAAYVAKRLKLLDLAPEPARAFAAGHIGVEHALLIAKLTPETQQRALANCFDGYFAGREDERSLIPASRLQEWIVRNVYLSLKSVPFSKDDTSLVSEAGSCTDCSKRTGADTLLFSEVRDGACSDSTCFNRKLDACLARRLAEMPKLVQISSHYEPSGEDSVLARRDYVEVIGRKTKSQSSRPEQKLCASLGPAIYINGFEKGRLVKICANLSCPVHFPHRKQEEKRQLEWKAERKAANQKSKQTLAFRHQLLAEVLKRVKPQLGCEELRLVTRFVLSSLPHELAGRLAKRHGFERDKKTANWEIAEKARQLYRKADAAQLAVLLFEAVLLGSAANPPCAKPDDLLLHTATVYKVDAKTIRGKVVLEAKD